jgi:hypothetical protein
MLHSEIAYFKWLFLTRNYLLSTFIANTLVGSDFSDTLYTLPKLPSPSTSIMSNELNVIPILESSSNSSYTESYWFAGRLVNFGLDGGVFLLSDFIFYDLDSVY